MGGRGGKEGKKERKKEVEEDVEKEEEEEEEEGIPTLCVHAQVSRGERVHEYVHR